MLFLFYSFFATLFLDIFGNSKLKGKIKNDTIYILINVKFIYTMKKFK